jgi:Haem-binding domain
MKRYFKIGLLILLGIFLVMQAFRPQKNIQKGVQANNITKLVPVPNDVQKILEKACNDCHTNNTKYPWYAEIMPVGWILNNHVVDGKKHINFDEYTTYKAKIAIHKLEEVAEQVEQNKMPMDNYISMHKEAKLSEAEKKRLIEWANRSKDSLKIVYKDSIQ